MPISTQFKMLTDCEPGELVRFRVGNETQWAIVGRPLSKHFPVLILSEQPYCLNAFEEKTDAIQLELEQHAVLSYGDGYELIPDHAGFCQVGLGALFETGGALILQGQLPNGTGLSGRYLRTFPFQPSEPAYYFELDTGLALSEPRGNRAAFAQWVLSLKADGQDGQDLITVKKFEVPTADASA
jgi:hypothetical protein